MQLTCLEANTIFAKLYRYTSLCCANAIPSAVNTLTADHIRSIERSGVLQVESKSRAHTWVVAFMFTASLIVGALGPVSSVSATSGSVLLHLDGNSGAYTDRSGTRAVLGSRQYSGYGRAFNVRMPPLTPPRDARLGTFPYGVFGLTGKDSNGDRDFTDAGDVDPVRLMGAM